MWEKVEEWGDEIKNHKYLILISIGLFILANIMSLLAASYVDKTITTQVPDLILDHLPTLDLDFIFVYGIIAIISIIILYGIIFKIREAHKILGQFSLLILVRSFFIVLTHLGQPAHAIILTSLPKIYYLFNFHNDLFFSSHTAIPFMAFLVFKKSKISWFFLACSIIMAFTVLAVHVHYSIDVFSAFFITYGVFKFGEWFFRKINHY